MLIHRTLDQLPTFKNAVLTIGSFDGVHAGHQQILQRITRAAKQVNGESVVITFHPHPRLVLFPEQQDLKLLTTVEEKAALLAQYGVDHLVLTPFSKTFAQQTPEAYVRDFLVHHFHPNRIIIGYDHKFGKNRAGDIRYLQQKAADYQFEVEEISKQEVEDVAVSSTKIRKALLQGDVAQAAKWLRHPYQLKGTVVRGQQIGRSIGFPTANVQSTIPQKLIPPIGVYAVRVHHKATSYGGMLYIGPRPTVGDNLAQTIEVNIFDFDQDIYGDTLQVDFIAHIRGDEKFEGLPALQAQLQRDKIQTQKILSNY